MLTVEANQFILILDTILTSQLSQVKNAKITKNHNYFLPFS